MGLFTSSAPFDLEVDKATNENNTAELWDVIMEICDKVNNSKHSKDCLRAIIRRLNHADPHVAMQAITLLDACINNCGKNFHLEIASRDFEQDFRRLLQRVQPAVALKLKLSLKRWAESEFKKDPELQLIPSLYTKLRLEGHDFTDSSAQQAKQAAQAPISKDPNVVSSQREQDDIAMAIELSLKEGASPKNAAASGSSSNSNPYASLYAATVRPTTATTTQAAEQQRRKVRALYDFEAAEDNELTFLAGEIFHVLDDSDPNWWKGYNQRGEGLFPSNFVTADLSVEPESLATGGASSGAQQQLDGSDAATASADSAAALLAAQPPTLVDIDEDKIDRLLHLLNEANPEDPSQDTDEMLRLEEQVNRMQPLIDNELERVDRKHAQLTQLSSDLVDAINLYHMLMREPERGPAAFGVGGAAYGMYGGGPAAAAAAASMGPYGGGMMSLQHGMQAMSMGPGVPHSLASQHPMHMNPAAAAAASPYGPMPGQPQPHPMMPGPPQPHQPNYGLMPQQQQQHPGVPGAYMPDPQQQQQQHQQPPQQHHQQMPPTQLQQQPPQQQQPEYPNQPQQTPSTTTAMQPGQMHQTSPPQQPQPQQIPATTAAAMQQQQQHMLAMQQQQQPTTMMHPNAMQHGQPNQYAMSAAGGGNGVTVTHTTMAPPNGGGNLPQSQPPQQQQQHQQPQPQQPYAMNNGGMPPNGGGLYYGQGYAANGMQPPPPHQMYQVSAAQQMQQHQQHQQQQQYASITQPITNTILPPADAACVNIPLYQQQR